MEVGEGGKEGGGGKGREGSERPQSTEGLREVVWKEEGGRKKVGVLRGGDEDTFLPCDYLLTEVQIRVKEAVSELVDGREEAHVPDSPNIQAGQSEVATGVGRAQRQESSHAEQKKGQSQKCVHEEEG